MGHLHQGDRETQEDSKNRGQEEQERRDPGPLLHRNNTIQLMLGFALDSYYEPYLVICIIILRYWGIRMPAEHVEGEPSHVEHEGGHQDVVHHG